MKAQQIWPGLSARDWTAPERRAVGLMRGGRALEEAAAEAKADPERVRAAWAIHAATPEGKAHLAANARVRVLGAEERARVEAELKGREGAPALRAEVEQLRQRLAQAEGLAAIEQQGREAAELEAKKTKDELAVAAKEAEADFFRLRDDREAMRSELEDTAHALKTIRASSELALAEREQTMRASTARILELEQQVELLIADRRDALASRDRALERADTAEVEQLRLTAQLQGIPELVAAVARIEAALTRGVKTQPSKLAAAVAEESAEEVAQLRAELAARMKERDASRLVIAELYRQAPVSKGSCSTPDCGRAEEVKGMCRRCYQRVQYARKAASR